MGWFGEGLKTKGVRSLLALEAARAREYYAAAEELLPLIDQDSRAALWVLVTIYRGLARTDYGEELRCFF